MWHSHSDVIHISKEWFWFLERDSIFDCSAGAILVHDSAPLLTLNPKMGIDELHGHKTLVHEMNTTVFTKLWMCSFLLQSRSLLTCESVGTDTLFFWKQPQVAIWDTAVFGLTGGVWGQVINTAELLDFTIFKWGNNSHSQQWVSLYLHIQLGDTMSSSLGDIMYSSTTSALLSAPIL